MRVPPVLHLQLGSGGSLAEESLCLRPTTSSTLQFAELHTSRVKGCIPRFDIDIANSIVHIAHIFVSIHTTSTLQCVKNALLHNCTPPQCIVPYFAILCNVHTTQCIVHIIIFVSEVIVNIVKFSCSNCGGGGEAGGVCTTLLITQLHNQPPQKWSRRRNYETALNALL